jgi:hypothetical protein
LHYFHWIKFVVSLACCMLQFYITKWNQSFSWGSLTYFLRRTSFGLYLLTYLNKIYTATFPLKLSSNFSVHNFFLAQYLSFFGMFHYLASEVEGKKLTSWHRRMSTKTFVTVYYCIFVNRISCSSKSQSHEKQYLNAEKLSMKALLKKIATKKKITKNLKYIMKTVIVDIITTLRNRAKWCSWQELVQKQ